MLNEYQEAAEELVKRFFSEDAQENDEIAEDILCEIADADLAVIEHLVELSNTALNPSAAVPGILPIETAPKDGRYILLFGDSGYTTTPYRCEICRYDAEYRPLAPWQNYGNDTFTDSGGEPIGWLPLPGEQA